MTSAKAPLVLTIVVILLAAFAALGMYDRYTT